jgi:hypothetical protein
VAAAMSAINCDRSGSVHRTKDYDDQVVGA